ncbi:MAG: hypothetical protein H0U81_07595 [Pyrinomonadaceae bacterium]|nr:hypothetical protein [Pyrinomonadaceae bacterium]
MKVLFVVLLALAGVYGTIAAQRPAKLDASKLLGVWKVDLRSTPDAPAYYQEFEVTAVDGSTFTGMFYNSRIKNGRLNVEKGAIYFAFTTEDGSSAYNTAGKLVGDGLEGTTHSLGRKFLLPWAAEREK